MKAILDALQENPSLVKRILVEGLKECLDDERFRADLLHVWARYAVQQGVEPIYNKSLTARLVPIPRHKLTCLVRRVEQKYTLHAPYYRLTGSAHRRERYYYASDIEKIRAYLNAPFKENTKKKFKSAISRQRSTGARYQGATIT